MLSCRGVLVGLRTICGSVRGRTALAALLALAALAGCGGSHSATHTIKTTPVTQPASVTQTTAPTPALASAVYPTCTFHQFRKPLKSPVVGPGGGRGWQLSYLPRPLARVLPGTADTVLIVEQSPSLPMVGVVHGRTISVSGHKVSIRAPATATSVFEAQWNTAHARYVALSNGNRPTLLEKFISCMP